MSDEHLKQEVSNEDSEFEKRLQTQLFRWDCPPAEALSDYHLGLLSGQEQQAIAAHLPQCLLCQAEIEQLAEFLAERSGRDARKPPQLHPAVFAPSVGVGLLPAGRGAKAGPQKLIFTLEATNQTIELFLDLHRQPGTYLLTGQFVPDIPTLDNALIEVWQETNLAATTVVDEMGDFMCELPGRGALLLRIHSGDGAILFGRVEF